MRTCHEKSSRLIPLLSLRYHGKPDDIGIPMDLRRYSSAGFHRGAPRWKEACWMLVRALFFLTPLPFPSMLRVFLLRCFGASIGERVVIRSFVNITFPWRLVVGDHVWIGDEAFILTLSKVEIESSVCISQRAFLCTGSHDHRRDDFALITLPIRVESGAWIAANAFVGPGVTIGAGAVVSAGSVVLRNVPPGEMVRGNPAVPVTK